MGADDIASSEVLTPSLSTTRADRFKVGQVLAAMLLAGDTVQSKPVMLPMELVVRDSVASVCSGAT